MSNYSHIAKVIHYISDHREEQPDLDMLADLISLSPSQFYRLFSEWAGITPKRFLQYLTLSDVKLRLLAGNSMLDGLLDCGLSCTGGSHDVCVIFQEASQGEIKSRGVGWSLVAGIAETPFGPCLIAESPRGICHLSFFNPLELSKHWKTLEEKWPEATLIRDDNWAHEFCKKVFIKGRRKVSLKLFVKGTAFQVSVWQALLQIPEGSLVSYGRVARLVGNVKGSRAVGSAVGNNPIGFLIPCHRVIRESGAIGRYAWGEDRKRAIQVWENGPAAQ